MKGGLLASLAFTVSLLSACSTPPDLTVLERSVTGRTARVVASLSQTHFGKSVSAAVFRSPELGQGMAALREAEAGLIAAGGAFQPEVSAGLRPDDAAGFGVEGFASLSLRLYDGGVSAARETAARARVLGGIAERHDAASQAAHAAVQAWSEVVTARALLAANETTLAALAATVARIEERTAAGVGASQELLAAQSRFANERAATVVAQAEVSRAEAVFFEIFGDVPAASLSLPPQAPRAPSEGAASSPLLYVAKSAVLAAEAEHAAALAGRVPTLAVTVSALSGAQAVAGLTSEHLVAPGNSRRARVAAAEARIDARRNELEATSRTLQRRLRILDAEAQAAESRLGAAQEANAANQANLAVLRDQFETGRQSLIGLFDAEREALTAQQQRITALHDRVVLSYAALAVTGDILDLFGIKLGDTSPSGDET